MKKLIVFVIALGFLSSCAVVKEYEKVSDVSVNVESWDIDAITKEILKAIK